MKHRSPTRGYAAIGLHMPKTSYNVGSVLRAANCYGASLVAMNGQRYRHASTDTEKAYRHIPFIQCGTASLSTLVPHDCIPVAVELVESAKSIVDYVHPERAFYVFGPEDGTLGQPVLSWCRDVIYIPTRTCMNLAATVNVVLYDRMVKRGLSFKEQVCTS